MAFNVHVEGVAGDAYVCRIGGSLDAGSAPDFQEAITPLVENPEAMRIILDMTDLEYIASAGLRVLLLLVKKVDERNARLFGVGVKGTVKSVLKMTGFFRYIEESSSVEECLS